MKIRNLLKSLTRFIKSLKKRRVRIDTLLQIKVNLEESINKEYERVDKVLFAKKKDNLSVKDQERLFKAALKDLDRKNKQLVYIKLAQQQANLKYHADGHTNFYYIYKLSNLNKFRDYLVKIKSKIGKKNLDFINFEEPNNMLKQVMDEIHNISEKLAHFNQTKYVKVKLVPGLNVL